MDTQVAFVHTKTHPPLHLILNYRRTSSLLHRNKVWMLHDTQFKAWKLCSRQSYLPRTQEEGALDAEYGYPKSFRDNFWFSSLVRFSLLARFMEVHDYPTIHIESDVVLSEDFPINDFSKITTPFAYPIVSSERAIASTIFIRDKNFAQFLWDFSKKTVGENPLASDMEILFSLWKKHPELVTCLPIAPSHLFKGAPQTKECASFDGYFDGHDFGVYIGGTNPWNKRGTSEIRTPIIGSLLTFDEKDFFYEQKRKFVSIRKDNSFHAEPLYSLHITNKNPLFFMKRFQSFFLRLWLVIYVRTDRTFHPIVFFLMILKAMRRRLFINTKGYRKG